VVNVLPIKGYPQLGQDVVRFAGGTDEAGHATTCLLFKVQHRGNGTAREISIVAPKEWLLKSTDIETILRGPELTPEIASQPLEPRTVEVIREVPVVKTVTVATGIDPKDAESLASAFVELIADREHQLWEDFNRLREKEAELPIILHEIEGTKEVLAHLPSVAPVGLRDKLVKEATTHLKQRENAKDVAESQIETLKKCEQRSREALLALLEVANKIADNVSSVKL
jgi:hypothetical protein